MSERFLLDFVHKLNVLLQLPAHHSQELLVLALELHHGHTSFKELGNKHAGSAGGRHICTKQIRNAAANVKYLRTTKKAVRCGRQR